MAQVTELVQIDAFLLQTLWVPNTVVLGDRVHPSLAGIAGRLGQSPAEMENRMCHFHRKP